jgi:hypothetical protein
MTLLTSKLECLLLLSLSNLATYLKDVAYLMHILSYKY